MDLHDELFQIAFSCANCSCHVRVEHLSSMISGQDTFAEAHLQSLVSSLGRRQDCRSQDSPYVRDPQCHSISMLSRATATCKLKRAPFPETLQDILRFLRHDQSRERPVTSLLHSWDFLENHLLPLVLTYHGSESLLLDAGEEVSVNAWLQNSWVITSSCSQIISVPDVACWCQCKELHRTATLYLSHARNHVGKAGSFPHIVFVPWRASWTTWKQQTSAQGRGWKDHPIVFDIYTKLPHKRRKAQATRRHEIHNLY